MIADYETGLYAPTHIGSKAAQGYTMNNKEIAQAIRADIKEAKKAGQIPASVKVSVRSNYHAIYVTLSGWTQEQIWVNTETINGFACKKWSDEADKVQAVVEEIRNAYNKECVNGMIDYFDVRYYGQTAWGN